MCSKSRGNGFAPIEASDRDHEVASRFDNEYQSFERAFTKGILSGRIFN
jgi:hypothetical protein